MFHLKKDPNTRKSSRYNFSFKTNLSRVSCSSVLGNLDYSGGQKRWDLSGDISKTSDPSPPLPSPPTPNKVEFRAPWVKMSAFLATTLLMGVGGRWDEPKVDQKIVIRSRGYLTGFFTQSQVLLSLIHTIPIFYDTDTFFYET